MGASFDVMLGLIIHNKPFSTTNGFKLVNVIFGKHLRTGLAAKESAMNRGVGLPVPPLTSGEEREA